MRREVRACPTKLAMPATFSTTSGRPGDSVPRGRATGQVPLSGVNRHVLMVAVLLFFDQNITVRIVNAESNKLKKPVGYHQDGLNWSLICLLAAGWRSPASSDARRGDGAQHQPREGQFGL